MTVTDMIIPDRRERGRPKGSKNTKTLVREFAAETRMVAGPDGPCQVKIAEFVLKRLVYHQTQGDARASKMIAKILDQFTEADERTDVLVVPETLNPEEWIRQAEIKNRFRDKPPDSF